MRVEYPGAIYHVTVRMLGDWTDDRARLFKDNDDRERPRLQRGVYVGMQD